jgi:Haem-binding domain
MPGGSVRRVLLWVGLGALVIFIAIQFVPYGWRHPNPPVTQDAPWPDEAAAAIARDSCYDCHSNETDWPWYTHVAPMSWLVRSDVESGRDALNFSTWDSGPGDIDHAIDQVAGGSMPPSEYTLIHRGTDLSEEEAATLLAALAQMPDAEDDDGGDDSGRGRGGDDDGGEREREDHDGDDG